MSEIQQHTPREGWAEDKELKMNRMWEEEEQGTGEIKMCSDEGVPAHPVVCPFGEVTGKRLTGRINGVSPGFSPSALMTGYRGHDGNVTSCSLTWHRMLISSVTPASACLSPPQWCVCELDTMFVHTIANVCVWLLSPACHCCYTSYWGDSGLLWVMRMRGRKLESYHHIMLHHISVLCLLFSH